MTLEEARALKAGDAVTLPYYRRRRRPATVVAPLGEGRMGRRGCLLVRKLGGKLAAGGRACWEHHDDIEREGVAPRPDAGPANVYADFLEENGFDDAAKFLRQAFPLAAGEGA